MKWLRLQAGLFHCVMNFNMPQRQTKRRKISDQLEPVEVEKKFPKSIVGAVGLVVIMMALAIWMLVREGAISTQPTHTLDSSVIIERASRHMLVNANENPTVVIIDDPAKARGEDPDFFRLAEVGDRVIIWPDKAVIYSPSKDKIVAVKNVSVDGGEGNDQYNQKTALELAKIEVRNGTRTSGLARVMTNKISAEGFQVFAPRDASKKPYLSTIIVKMSDKPLPLTIEKLIEMTGASEGALPMGEKNVRGDVLIIIGNDYIKR